MRWLSAVAIVFGLSGTVAASPPRSNQLTDFDIHQCQAQGCFRARGKIAFLSHTRTAIAAADATLEIAPTGGKRSQVISCASLRYDLASQYLSCDNREIQNATTLTIDADFEVTKY